MLYISVQFIRASILFLTAVFGNPIFLCLFFPIPSFSRPLSLPG
ncbi:putative membrane protein [Bacteroides fragilis str. 3783N1-2]|nr:putative membrane protein [Bacteroides fragilis str. 3783N1-2]EXZ67316.1 putative membrane protein [Bacteroides fragilis str. 3783N1-8]